MNTHDSTFDVVLPRETLPAEAHRRILLDNAHATVIETTYPVGSSVPMHTHAYPHAAYVIEGGVLEIRDAAGHASRLDVPEALTLWREPQNHSTRNVGTTAVKILEVEVKPPLTAVEGERVPRILNGDELTWTPDPFDARRSIAMLSGDPRRPGRYDVRIRLEPGYEVGLHAHPAEDEHLTVLRGVVHVSTREQGPAEHVVRKGGYIVIPARTDHRLWVTEATEVQMTGVGPRLYEFADPASDPRQVVQHY